VKIFALISFSVASVLSHLVLAPGVLGGEDFAALRAMRCDSPADVAGELAADVVAGRARVARVERDGARVGFVVFEVTSAHEFVVHAAFSGDSHRSLLPALVDAVDAAALREGCTSVSFSTARPGLVAGCLKLGFRVSEVVMRRAVA
jgi:hypothetical protein